MVDRLRFLLDRPLGQSAARAVVALASAVFIGLAALLALAAATPDRPASREVRPTVAAPFAPVPSVERAGGSEEAEPRPLRPRQDPQDVQGSDAARRAARALRSHRALQHVPYRDGGVTIALAGARGNRAVLRVSAPTVVAAREGWQRFLRRFRDAGRAYVPAFRATGGGDG